MAPHNPLPPDTGRGLWTQTASIDWCESNYELSYYIAEFWNTISNLAFIVPQLAQYVALNKYDYIGPAFKNALLSLALVGVGSFCFHMTLAKPMQMFDETSMIVVTLHGFYLLYIIKQPDVNRRRLATLLVCYGLVFLALYVFLVAWPIFHHSIFGIIVYASTAIGYQLKRIHGPNYTFWTVIILQHLAVLFWMIDKHGCEVLTQFREHHVPAFLRPFFQFHAIWHLLMGIASHLFICGLIQIRALTKHKEKFVIKYNYLGLWITLEKVNEDSDNPMWCAERCSKQTFFSEANKTRHESKQLALDCDLKHRLRQTSQQQNLSGPDQHFDLNQNQVQSEI